MNTKDRKKLAAGVGTGFLALALIGGGTFAAWTDFDTVQDNRVRAGQLVAVAQNNSMRVGGLAPGGSETLNFEITNRFNSSTPATVSFQLARLAGQEDGCSNMNSERDADGNCDNGSTEGELIQDAVATAAFRPGPCDDNEQGAVYAPTNLRTFEARAYGFTNVLEAGSTGCVKLAVSLPRGADNASQGDSVTFDMKLNLTQSS